MKNLKEVTRKIKSDPYLFEEIAELIGLDGQFEVIAISVGDVNSGSFITALDDDWVDVREEEELRLEHERGLIPRKEEVN